MLASDDNRQRANAVESLWGYDNERVRAILWQATNDSCSRVVVNALVGLCQLRDRKAYERLVELAEEFDPVVRSGGAWGMGEIGDPEFAPVLDKLAAEDIDANVRAMAAKSRAKLRMPQEVQDPSKPDLPCVNTEITENGEAVQPARDSQTIQYVRMG
jgi:HEAT repeat protein